MRRVHLKEISDQSWCPKPLRDGATDFLQFFENLSNVFGSAYPLLRRAMEQTNTRHVIDLCSGSGGPWLKTYRVLRDKERFPIKVCLTDRVPNIDSYERNRISSGNGLVFHPIPVDALSIPHGLRGFRTFFNSFHHFQPDEARSILQDAVTSGQGIGIFEATERNPLAIARLIMFLPILVFILTPFVRPFSLSRLFWTYPIPLLPFIITLDGIISCLRTYTPRELKKLTKQIRNNSYEWAIGMQNVPHMPGRITYLIGYPADGISENSDTPVD